MIIAVASVCGILIIQQRNLHGFFRFPPFVLALPVLSYAFSGKWTAVVSEVVAFLVVALYSSHFLKSKKFILANVSTILVSLGLGLFPIAFRNLISFQNPLYPFQFGPFQSGYFSLSSYSNHLGDLYASQVNWSNYSVFEQGVREYLVSPFQTLYGLFLKLPRILNLDFSSVIQDPLFFRTFVYDNRLGGFGPILLLALIILTFFLRLSYREISFFWIGIATFFFLPSSIHSRYYLTVGIVFVWIFLDICSKRNFNVSLRNPMYVITMTIALVFASVNVAALTYRLFPSGITNYPVDQSTSELSRRINPDCSEILHVGSGIWGVSSVWGPNMCGSVFGGINVNGFLFESEIGTPELNKDGLIDVYRFASSENGRSKRIICSFPKAKENPCSEIKRNLLKKFNIETVSSGLVSEAITGPTLESLLITPR
jgi:hypothetical protein